MKKPYHKLTAPLLIFILSFLVACTPHPGAGVWKSNGDNKMGIERLVVGFDGKAEFVSKQSGNANWHCFWGKLSDNKLSLTCTPSTNPSQKRSFILSTSGKDKAELYEFINDKNNTLLATFIRLDENPSPRK